MLHIVNSLWLPLVVSQASVIASQPVYLDFSASFKMGNLPFLLWTSFWRACKFRQRPVAAAVETPTCQVMSSRNSPMTSQRILKVSDPRTLQNWCGLNSIEKKHVSQKYSSFCWQTKHGGLPQGDWLTSCQAFCLVQSKRCTIVAGFQSIQS